MYIIYVLGYLLPWRITTGPDAEGYLRRPHPKELEENRPGNNKCDEKLNKSKESETNNPTKKILYKEKKPKKEPDKTETKTETPAEREETKQEFCNETNKPTPIVMGRDHTTLEGDEVCPKHLNSSKRANTFAKETRDGGPDKDTRHDFKEQKQNGKHSPEITIRGKHSKDATTTIERNAT